MLYPVAMNIMSNLRYMASHLKVSLYYDGSLIVNMLPDKLRHIHGFQKIAKISPFVKASKLLWNFHIFNSSWMNHAYH